MDSDGSVVSKEEKLVDCFASQQAFDYECILALLEQLTSYPG
ncbi:hypothetical protein HMPREF1247_1059 [Atopobium sp. BV3Ac4]|nr:hypothetical protein HMPREF1247_1059 [Atopobium sp. BV3Ac4]